MKRTIYLAMGVGVAATVILLLSLWSGSSVIVPQVLAAPAEGKGAEFFDNPVPGIIQWTDPPEVDICMAVVSPPTDDINDFILVNPNGPFLHITDHPATLTLTMASGQVFTGTGQFTVNWHAFFGGKNQSLAFTATGRVSDGLITLQAVCNFTQDAKGVIQKNAIDLR